MNQMGFPILTTVTFLPLVGAVLLLFIPSNREELLKRVTLVISLVEFIISLPLFIYFDEGVAGMQFVERVPWIKEWGVTYFMGIDGISLFLVLLTTFLTVLCILSSWTAVEKRIKEYMISFLFLETGMIGAFVALDLILFYVFWEVMLIPMYLIIGAWGGPRRVYAAIKFFLYTMAGSVLMLVAIIALYFLHGEATGEYTFDLLKLYQVTLPIKTQCIMFGAFGLAFAIKVPMFPFHTWLPDAHVEAPTAGSVILAGILLKLGTYGFIRFAIPLFPAAAFKAIPIISILALIGIIYGALVSMMQDDLKKLVAFSSVSHLGFVMLGMFAFNVQGVQGSIYQMLNHGVSTGALFLIVGMIYERRHTRLIADFGGLSRVMPIFATFFMIVALSSIALPGTNGFVGEFLILLGTFKANPVYGVFGATGVVLAAAYMLWMFQRVMFGDIKHPENRGLKDLNLREIVTLAPIVIMVIWMGVFPKFFFKKMDLSVEHFLYDVKARYEAAVTASRAGEGEPSLAKGAGGSKVTIVVVEE
ncbi:MAG: NADH-quinone oxidoreductase subunit M [Deltaproteobacteria bacterium]|nr:MAG: NADH-quinone oxidoreductase subunit M [Deltaproteobacteria bacterium]